jgi:hypothetical protein
MERVVFRTAIAVVALIIVGVMVPTATADPITWTLSGVTFSDGATASGSFVYNADTDTVSSVEITTTSGALFSGATYSGVDPGFGPSALQIVLVTNPSLADFTGTGALVLSFMSGSGLTDLGGTVALGGGEALCNNLGCTSGTLERPITGGDAISSSLVATPEPGSLFLLGIGMFSLIGMKRNRFPV